MEYEYLKYLGDDVTFCMANCRTDCRRNPKYIFHKDKPHSFSDFSKICKAYREKEEKNE